MQWEPPLSCALEPKWVNSSVKEEAGKPPHVRCKVILDMYIKRKKVRKKPMCLLVETGREAGQRGGVGDFMGSRARRTVSYGREQRTFVSFLAAAGAGGMQCLHSSYFNILRKHEESGSKLLLSSPPRLPLPLLKNPPSEVGWNCSLLGWWCWGSGHATSWENKFEKESVCSG